MSAAEFDLIVVGGGINGAGVAQAAAAAGHSVALLEQYPTLAAGTSSRSSKLVHGGLRYLESGHFKLVRESLAERATLIRIAPELVQLNAFHIPVYDDSRRGAWQIRAGLSLYALLGGLHPENRFARLPRADWDGLDDLNTEGLKAVFRYYDAQTDDGALTRAVAASAQSLGAEIRMHARCESIVLDDSAAFVVTRENDSRQELRARAVVNAGGPWVNEILGNVRPAQTPVSIDLVQGAHLVLPGELEKGIYYVEAADGRAIFAMPWRDNIMVGTTESPWRDDPAAAYPLDSEIDYLLEAFAAIFPAKRARRSDIVAAFAGLRVLPAGGEGAFRRSREVVLTCDREKAAQLVNIYGGKLSTFMATARKVMHLLAATLPERSARADVTKLHLEPVD